MLAEMPEVEELNPVPDAHVPVMNFKFDGVSIDLLYAKLDLWVIPEVSISYSLEKLWGLHGLTGICFFNVSYPVLSLWICLSASEVSYKYL